MSLTKKWSSLPILHFAIFHHYCHETGHSGFILQPNKKLSKGNLFTTAPTITFLSFQFIVTPNNFEKPIKLQLPILLATYPLRNEDGTMRRKTKTEYPTTLPIFRPWLDEKNLWHPGTQTVTWSKSDSGLWEHSSPQQPDSLPVKLSLGISDIWCDRQWRVESNCILLDQNSYFLYYVSSCKI